MLIASCVDQISSLSSIILRTGTPDKSLSKSNTTIEMSKIPHEGTQRTDQSDFKRG